MNLNIKNYGQYRVTDYDRAEAGYQLFNRVSQKVYPITKDEFDLIDRAASLTINPETACRVVEDEHEG